MKAMTNEQHQQLIAEALALETSGPIAPAPYGRAPPPPPPSFSHEIDKKLISSLNGSIDEHMASLDMSARVTHNEYNTGTGGLADPAAAMLEDNSLLKTLVAQLEAIVASSSNTPATLRVAAVAATNVAAILELEANALDLESGGSADPDAESEGGAAMARVEGEAVRCSPPSHQQAQPPSSGKQVKLSEIVVSAFNHLICNGDTRETGKSLAYATEHIIAPEWLKFECGIETISSPDDSDGQQEKYDRLTSNKKRVQIKYRGGKTLHIEQTRRTSGKNKNNGAKNGQVRYTIHDFDVILFIVPDNNFDTIENWKFIAIPAHVLEDPKMPGYCRASVPVSIKNEYMNNAKEIMTNIEYNI